MPKLASKLEDYKAPWEIDKTTGEEIPEDEQTLDKGTLKKYLFGLLGDKERLQTTVTTVTGERDTLKTELEAKAREGETDSDKVKRETAAAIKAAEDKGSLAALKLEVALDVEGITPAQAKRLAKRLTGTTVEELTEDAKGLVEDFGIGKTAEPQGDEDDEAPAETRGFGRPKRPAAAGDPKPNETKTDASPQSVDELFPRR